MGGGRMWLWGNGLGFVVTVEGELGAGVLGVDFARWGQGRVLDGFEEGVLSNNS